MNVNSNSYTYTFAIGMVVLVAAVLSFTALSLKAPQERNIELEKKQEILRSLGIEVDREKAEAAFETTIKEQVVLQNGQVVASPAKEAFTIDLAATLKLPEAERQIPLFVAEQKGNRYYIIPVRGKGLWGPIWGYVALESDGNTVFGATFGHKGDTPVLGAEISTPVFTDPFKGKKLLDGANFVSIEVRKGDAAGEHQVNGISGGTITSVGVQAMLKDCLAPYTDYFKLNQKTVSAL
jgi:Na+-transporting NADH:ubiquinone oxidoreductase subunit C